MKKPFPLEPLVKLRRDRVDRRANELGEAERRALAEKAALDEARARREKAETRAKAQGEAERTRLEEGLVRAHDLTRAELHRVRERLRVEALANAERRAEKKSEVAGKAVGSARSALGEARAEARILERQEERFRRDGERAALSAEEEAASDFHAIRSRRRKR
ncbi:MAG TPA: hypothetical protein VF103_00995 [Polyangiaceae bacterium]